jgi:DNA-binding transcriptional regulator GbsR (MarR family)
MVNTRVRHPTLRKFNRRLDRQKKAMMRQNKRLLDDQNDKDAEKRVNDHRKKIADLKRMKGGVVTE